MREENNSVKYMQGQSSDLDQETSSDPHPFDGLTTDPNDSVHLNRVGHRRHFGTHIPFSWQGNEPRFTIGPHCKSIKYPPFLNFTRVSIPLHVDFLDGGGNLGYFLYCDSSVSFNFILNFGVDNMGRLYFPLHCIKKSWNCEYKSKWWSRNWTIYWLPKVKFFSYDNHLTKLSSFCKACKILKTMDITHCYDCDVCIRGFDHHCPWTGKCIGEGNLKQFYLFVSSTVLYIVFCIIITAQNL